jgi:hypothetical protein
MKDESLLLDEDTEKAAAKRGVWSLSYNDHVPPW